VASGGAIGGTITSALSFSTASAPVIDASAQTSVRTSCRSTKHLAADHQTSQDASFKRVNLLGGDQLKLTSTRPQSTLNITGVTFNAAGLGLAT